MHLKQKAIPREGSKVRKGDKIGEVGDTGNASGLPPPLREVDRPRLLRGRRRLQRS